MANNVTLLDSTGTPYTVATDQTGGASGPHAQRVKVVFGVEDTVTDASSSNPLPVTVISSAAGSTVGTENGTIASGHTSVAEVMAMLYTFTGADHTRAGATPWQTYDLDESAEQVKATAGIVYGYHWQNRHATSERFLKFYNHAAPTVGGGSPTVPAFVIGMKPNSEANLWCGPPGIGFTTAISVAATTGFADSDVGAPGLNEVLLTVFRK
jgi:hypothetical protein